ncbi:MAG: hypothetical protein KDA17_07485 [Candidatus Saccharibacteria bacterium]|nr:hypothetical protein [Candidatus Saccharibacteria bacterium]
MPAGGAYPAVVATRASIAPHGGAYEEHLEKAARLSTEMGQYKQVYGDSAYYRSRRHHH